MRAHERARQDPPVQPAASELGLGQGLVLERGDDWVRLRTDRPVPPRAGALRHLGRPGLWKITRRNGRRHRIFELPADLIRSAGRPSGAGAAAGLLAWAKATAQGRAPADWLAPEPGQLDAWLPQADRVVQHRRFVRPVKLLAERGRLALRVELLERVPGDLPPARSAWLRELLAEANDMWRLVRVGIIRAGGARSVRAEVDLTGAPAARLKELLRISLQALRWVCGWLIEPVAFLADVAATCLSLERCPVRADAQSCPGKELAS